MGAPKSKWTAEEEEALRAGIQKHGAGKWRTIQKDPEFSRCLAHRSNIDLKDKWRNLSVTAGGPSSRDKVRMPKFKALPAPPLSSHAPAAPGTPNEDGLLMLTDSTKNSQDGKGLRSTAMIMEALTTMQERNGSDIGAICHFIEERYEVPANFRRMLSSKLRRLVAQNKIEKVENGYKAKESLGTETPTPIERDSGCRPRHPTFPSKTDQMEELAKNAAYKIADAEAKSFLAAEAAKELEKVIIMAEESEAILVLAKEIYERCSRGEVVTLI